MRLGADVRRRARDLPKASSLSNRGQAAEAFTVKSEADLVASRFCQLCYHETLPQGAGDCQMYAQ